MEYIVSFLISGTDKIDGFPSSCYLFYSTEGGTGSYARL